MSQARTQASTSILDDLFHDARLGLRQLLQKPGWALAALSTLALGLGSATAVFSFADAMLWRPFPFSEPDRLVMLWEIADEAPIRSVAPGNYVDWRDQLTSVESLAAYTFDRVVLGSDPDGGLAGAASRLEAQRVTGDFFRLLGARPSHGRLFSAEDERIDGLPGVVLSHELWRERFGADPDVAGRVVQIDDVPHHVLGVAPAGLRLERPVDLFLQGEQGIPAFVPAAAGDPRRLRDAHFLNVVARLADDASIETVRTEIGAVAARLASDHPETNEGLGATAQPLRDWLVGEGGAPLVNALGGGVLLLLLLATVNVAGLVLARGQGRARELAVRASLGAGRGRLARQLVVETLVLTTLGGGLGLLLSGWLLALLDSLLPGGLRQGPNPVQIDGRVMLFGVFLTLICGVLVGLWPAVAAGRRDPLQHLRGGTRGTSGRTAIRARSVLTVSQLALAQVLLAVAALLVVSLLRVMDVDAGNSHRDLLTFQVTLSPERYGDLEARNTFYRDVETSLAALPGVEAASAMLRPPLGGVAFNRGFHIEGRPPKTSADSLTTDQQVIGPDYFSTLGVPLLAGRAFGAADGSSAEPVVVVNRTLVERHWPDESVGQVVGRRIAFGSVENPRWMRIVGVAADVLQRDLVEAARPTAYTPYAQTTDSFLTMAFALRTSRGTPVDPSSVAPSARAAVAGLDPTVPIASVATFDQLMASGLGFRRALAWLLAAFAGFALLLSAVGVYGIVSYQTAQRSREVALRMALGADRTGVVGLVLRGGAKLLGAGLTAGVPLALVASRLFESQLFDVARFDPAPYLAVAALLSVVVLAAVWLPARRASRLEPASLLREQ